MGLRLPGKMQVPHPHAFVASSRESIYDSRLDVYPFSRKNRVIRHRFHFSILTMLGLITLIAVGLAIYRQWVAWPAAEAEFTELIYISTPSSENRRRAAELVWEFPLLAKDKRALRRAAQWGDVELCRLLLDNGAKIDGKDPKSTPFYHAVVSNEAEIVQMFIERGVDPKSPASLGTSCEELGYTPLHLAAQRRATDVCELLIKEGCDIHAKTNRGVSTLRCGICSGEPSVVELLLKHGARDGNPPGKVLSHAHLRADISQAPTFGSFPRYITRFASPEEVDQIIQLLDQHCPEMFADTKEEASQPLQR